MLFGDLQSFLQIRPGSGVLEQGDDRVMTPFVIPGVKRRFPSCAQNAGPDSFSCTTALPL